MAAKKKTKKKIAKSKPSARAKLSSRKKAAAGKARNKRGSVKSKGKRNTIGVDLLTTASAERSSLGRNVTIDTAPHVPKELGPRFGGQSGALQGLSDLEASASESVDELLEEGNAFEAEIVKGVEDAGNDGERPVPIHRVAADDVPEENVPDEYFRKE